MRQLNVFMVLTQSAVWGVLMSGLISCQSSRRLTEGDNPPQQDSLTIHTQESSELQSVALEPASNYEVRFDPAFKVTRPWHVVFVSKDGPKGHEHHAVGQCGSSVWCQIWEGAQQAGMMAGAEVELAYVPTECSDSYECTTSQIQLIDQLIRRGEVDGMVIGPRESNLLVPVVEKAIAAGIPVLVTDTPLNTEQVVAQVLPDDYQMGELLGHWVVRHLKGKGNVLLLNGPETQANALNRKSGMLSGLSTGNMRVLDIQYAEWTAQEAATITRQWLTEFSDIDAIMTGGGDLALGVVTELNTQSQSDMLITSFDVYPQIRAAITTGDIDITVDQRLSLQGQLGVQLLLRYLENDKDIPPIVHVPDIFLLGQENVDAMAPTGL